LNIATSFLAVASAVSVSLPSEPSPVCEPVEPVVVLCTQSGTELMDTEELVIGCIMGEMPYTFDAEALKAQAVAARTYLYYCIEDGSRHENGDICGNAAHCLCYISKEEYANRYGEAAAELACEAARKAVEDTKGELIYHDGEIILAVWHSSSDGYTEDSGEVWLNSLDYLKSVKSVEARKITEESFTVARVREILRGAGYMISRVDRLSMTKTPSGRCDTMTVGELTLDGGEVRRLFSLKSTDFDVRLENGEICFTVRGYGHGVGMSQYGADAMAKDGYGYREIISHYYSGAYVE